MFPIDIDFSRLKEVLTYDPQAPMIFSSGIFLWLFAAFMIVYTLLQRKYTARILFVTLFSYYFYYKSSGTYFSCWRWSRFATSCWRNGWTVPKDAGNAKGW